MKEKQISSKEIKITSLRKVKIESISILPVPGNGAKNLLLSKLASAQVVIVAHKISFPQKLYIDYQLFLPIT